MLKFTYAKTRLTGGDSSWATQAYLENIKAFNGFYEEEPRKTTPLDFVQAFDQLLPSFREHGFGPDFPPVAISPSGELLDGAHRVATAAALGLAVPTVVRDLEAHWNYSFFSTRGQSTLVGDFAASQTLAIDKAGRLAFVFGCVNPVDFNIFLDELKGEGKVKYVKSLRLGGRELVSLKRLLYSGDEHSAWLGSKNDRFSGAAKHARASRGRWPIRILLVSDISDQALLAAKARLRHSAKRGNFSIHTTDSWSESHALGRLVFSPHAQTILRNLSDDWESIAGQISLALATAAHCRKETMLFVGSVVLDLLGVRKSRDIDFLSVDEPCGLDAPPGLDFHGSELRHYAHPPQMVLSDPRLHFSLGGFYFLAPRQLAEFKRRRREFPKDFLDRLALFLRLGLQVPGGAVAAVTALAELAASRRRILRWLQGKIEWVYIAVVKRVSR